MKVYGAAIFLALAPNGLFAADSLVCPKEDQPTGCNRPGIDCPVIRVPPLFPEECLVGQTGTETVTMQLTIESNGLVRYAEVMQSTNACFNSAALKNICRSRFELEHPEGVADRVVLKELNFKWGED